MPRTSRSPFHSQAGGITILVALMLLVLLTVAAVGMSRNAFRETVISGTVRQGALSRNVGDSGIEWSIFWLYPNNSTTPSVTAQALKNLQLQLLVSDNQSGIPYDPTTLAPYNTTSPPPYPADLALPTQINASGQPTTMGYSVALTRMGKLPVMDSSQSADSSGLKTVIGGSPRMAPDLWAVRSDARVTVGTGLLAPTFVHAKEAWVSTPVQ